MNTIFTILSLLLAPVFIIIILPFAIIYNILKYVVMSLRTPNRIVLDAIKELYSMTEVNDVEVVCNRLEALVDIHGSKIAEATLLEALAAITVAEGYVRAGRYYDA